MERHIENFTFEGQYFKHLMSMISQVATKILFKAAFIVAFGYFIYDMMFVIHPYRWGEVAEYKRAQVIQATPILKEKYRRIYYSPERYQAYAKHIRAGGLLLVGWLMLYMEGVIATIISILLFTSAGLLLMGVGEWLPQYNSTLALTRQIAISPELAYVQDRLIERMQNTTLWSLIYGLITMVVCSILLVVRGHRRVSGRHIKGSQLVSNNELISIIKSHARNMRYRWEIFKNFNKYGYFKITLLLDLIVKFKGELGIKIGKIPMIKEDETKHILLLGTTGSGKSNCIRSMLRQITDRGEKAIIFDNNCEYVESMYRPDKDIILNPFDARSVDWSVWNEGAKGKKI